MKKEIFKKIIVEWMEKELPDLIERDYVIKNVDKINYILAIIGPRRSGKTFFMFQIIKLLLKEYNKNDILFIDFEDYRIHPLHKDDIELLLKAYYELYQKHPKFLFLDEIQNLQDFSRILRYFHNTGKYKIFVSGSSSKLLSQEISTELRGRYRSLTVLPFSFKEFLKLKKIEYNKEKEYSIKIGEIYKAFQEYSEWGGFPEVAIEGDIENKKELLKNYFSTIFYKDLIARYNIKLNDLLEMLMNYILSSYSTLFSITNFEKWLRNHKYNVSKRTIANYLYFIKEIFFIILGEKFSFSTKKRVMNPKKVYLIDTGFIKLSTEFSENRGKILENIVAIDLLRRGKEFFYYKNSYECDFIIKEGLSPEIAIQVTLELNEKNYKCELKGLLKAMDEFSIKDGIILTYDTEENIKEKNKDIKVYPLWKFLLDLSQKFIKE